MMSNSFRVVVPMVVVRGKIHYHTGRRDSMILKALIEAIHASGGDLGDVVKIMGLPEPVIANLVASAARQGLLTWDDEIALYDDVVEALDGAPRHRWSIAVFRNSFFRAPTTSTPPAANSNRYTPA